MTKEVETSIPARDWYNYFSDLFSNNDFPQKDLNFSDEESLRSNRNPVDSSCLNLPIADDEIINSVKSINNNRSPGPDGINIEMYKHTLTLELPYLNKLFNEIFDSGIFPLDWGKSIITLIHKKGSKTDPYNYRAISLIDSICKIFMNILNCRLSRWCEENTILDESQAGFREGYSTIDNIFILTALAQKYLSKKRGRFYCIFIDFEKAFDNVQHSQLWTALERINVDGKFLNILKSVYNNTRSCIKVNHILTEFFNCSIGTRQGCVASPKNFSIFINDLINYLQNKCGKGIFVSNEIRELYALMFADDIPSFSDTVLRLQKQIDCISDYTKIKGMKINADKTKIVVFRNGGIVKKLSDGFWTANR